MLFLFISVLCKRGCNRYAKKCLLGENVSIEWKMCLLGRKVSTERCPLKGHNPSYRIYKKVPIDWKDACWPKMCLPKGVYWKITILQIGYTKRCLLIEKMPIGRKCVIKRCLLKCHNLSYWIFKKVSIDRKDAYWPKRCLLKCHNSSY